MALSKKHSISIAAAIVVLGGVAYFFWMQPSEDPNVTVAGSAGVAQAAFLTLASQLEPVVFDADVLNDPRFTSLVDIQTTILPEAGGRVDPFAPLPGVRTQ